MFCITSGAEGEGVPVWLVLGPQWFVAGRSGAMVLLLFSVACFWCRRSGDVSPLVGSYYF